MSHTQSLWVGALAGIFTPEPEAEQAPSTPEEE